MCSCMWRTGLPLTRPRIPVSLQSSHLSFSFLCLLFPAWQKKRDFNARGCEGGQSRGLRAFWPSQRKEGGRMDGCVGPWQVGNGCRVRCGAEGSNPCTQVKGHARDGRRGTCFGYPCCLQLVCPVGAALPAGSAAFGRWPFDVVALLGAKPKVLVRLQMSSWKAAFLS